MHQKQYYSSQLLIIQIIEVPGRTPDGNSNGLPVFLLETSVFTKRHENSAITSFQKMTKN